MTILNFSFITSDLTDGYVSPIQTAQKKILVWGLISSCLSYITIFGVEFLNEAFSAAFIFLAVALFHIFLVACVMYRGWVEPITHVKIIIGIIPHLLSILFLEDPNTLLIGIVLIVQIILYSFFILNKRWSVIYTTLAFMLIFLGIIKQVDLNKSINPTNGSINYSFALNLCFNVFFVVYAIYNIITSFKKSLNTLAEQSNEIKERSEESQVQAEELQILNKTLQLQKRSEQRARLEADEANASKSTFLAMMSHEIRTPMNGVLGMASLLSNTSLSVEQREYTETIRVSGEALLNVINDILDFSKIESGNLEIVPYDFELRKCIEEVLDLFAVKASEAGLDLVYRIDSQIPARIIADRLRLRQVLLNLIGNAIKFTSSGEVFIEVTLNKADLNELDLCFKIKDTGIGIQADKLPRLFKPFSQVDSFTTRKYGGTGLGLVISERLIKLMSGNIQVESEFGSGTTFSFTIICSEGKVKVYPDFTFDNTNGKRVLIVDDNLTNLKIMESQLISWKLEPVLAKSGREALEVLFKRNDIDLLITDMQMPEINGVQLSTSVKKEHPKLPIILLSSIGDETRTKYTQLFSAILTKPIKQQNLFNVIQLALKQDKETDEALTMSSKKSTHLLSVEFAQKYPFRILIAEDNLINQKLIVTVLTKLGYQPSLAINGREVLNMLDHEHFDLIFMDVQMPEMDGIEATKAIREHYQNQPLIIAMTANAMANDMEDCLNAGMNNYLAKPINLIELLALIESIYYIRNER